VAGIEVRRQLRRAIALRRIKRSVGREHPVLEIFANEVGARLPLRVAGALELERERVERAGLEDRALLGDGVVPRLGEGSDVNAAPHRIEQLGLALGDRERACTDLFVAARAGANERVLDRTEERDPFVAAPTGIVRD